MSTGKTHREAQTAWLERSSTTRYLKQRQGLRDELLKNISHKAMLDAYSQKKNIYINLGEKALGSF